MTKQKANYTLTIEADSGYESTTEGRCTADQYGQAIAALHGETPQRKPLTEEQIDDIASEHSDEFGMIAPDSWEDFARDIEAAHGIKGDA